MTSTQRYPVSDQVKEPHSVSLKVLRLSRPSLVAQLPIPPLATAITRTATTAATTTTTPTPPTAPIPASLAYAPSSPSHPTNPHPFLLTPILQLPPSFGSAYIGETFSCTLCANHEAPTDPPPPATSDYTPAPPPALRRTIRDVRIDAEMKTPSSAAPHKLALRPPRPLADDEITPTHHSPDGVDLDAGQTLQRIVDFDLKDDGNHVLGVTVSYYEATATSGRSRSFRKLYQFVCKPSLIIRTKAGLLGPVGEAEAAGDSHEGEDAGAAETAVTTKKKKRRRRKWVLEAQLENCSDDTMELEMVDLTLEAGLDYRDCNWATSGAPKPVLHPREVEQVCFVVQEKDGETAVEEDGRVVFGLMGVGWRGEMGSKGFLKTNKLGART